MKKIDKNILIFISISLGLLIVGLSIGLILNFVINQSQFLFLFLINYPLSVLVYLSFIYLSRLNEENPNRLKKKILISSIVRYFIIFLALGFSTLYLYLTDNLVKPWAFYILVSPCVITISLLSGAFLARKGEN